MSTIDRSVKIVDEFTEMEIVRGDDDQIIVTMTLVVDDQMTVSIIASKEDLIWMLKSLGIVDG